MADIKKQNSLKEETEDMMILLLKVVSEELLTKIKSGDYDARDISNAIKLCKDNGIDINVKKGEPLQVLGEILPFNINGVVNE